MKFFETVAVIALAGAGFLAHAQTYTQQFSTAKPELDKLMASMQYRQAIEKINAILPPAIPDFAKDPGNPQVALNHSMELGSLLDLNDYLWRAQLMSGNSESALSTIANAEVIARKNATELESDLAPTITLWTEAIEKAKTDLEELIPLKEQVESELKKAKGKKAKTLEGQLAAIQENIDVSQGNLTNAPVVIAQLNKFINDAKNETTKFSKDITDIESDLKIEKEEIAKFDGDKAKYVTAAADDRNLSKLPGQKEKVKYLNRLLFLDPQNAVARKQLDAVLGN